MKQLETSGRETEKEKTKLSQAGIGPASPQQKAGVQLSYHANHNGWIKTRLAHEECR